MKATDILWDVDNEEELELLPKEVDIPVELTDEEEISDYLSELTGYCHCGFSLSTDSPQEKIKRMTVKRNQKPAGFAVWRRRGWTKSSKWCVCLETAPTLQCMPLQASRYSRFSPH